MLRKAHSHSFAAELALRCTTIATVAAAMLLMGGRADAVCRVVEPVEESGQRPVAFDPNTTVLYVSAPGQLVDYYCRETTPVVPPAPLPYVQMQRLEPNLDQPVQNQALDIQVNPWFSLVEIEWAYNFESTDPTVCDDGSRATPVLDTLTHVVIQPSIYASGGSAGLIMPLPARADVHTAPTDIFDAVNMNMRALVEEAIEFREDLSLGGQCGDPHYSALDGVLDAPGVVYGCADTGGEYYRAGLEDYDTEDMVYGQDESGGVVRLEQIEVSADYGVTVLNASNMMALTAWLDDNNFAHSEVDDAAFAHYVADGAWFLAVDLHPQDLGGQRVGLEPLVVTWRGSEIPVQNELTYQPMGGQLTNDTFILAPTQMVPADGSGAIEYSAPALELRDERLSGFGLTQGWITRVQMSRNTGVQVEDSHFRTVEQPAVIRPTLTRHTSVRIAAACCPYGGLVSEERIFVEHRTYLEGDEPGDESLFYRAQADESVCDRFWYCSVSSRRAGQLFNWLPILGAIVFVARRKRRKGPVS